jgi:anti-sigma B factor antagonist
MPPLVGRSIVAMTVNLTERSSGNVTIIDVSGAAKMSDGSERYLHDKIRSLLQQGKKKILVNLAGVPYLDSVGLGDLVQCYATVTQQGGSMKLLNAASRLRDLLVITKLATVFETFDDEKQAVESFAG